MKMILAIVVTSLLGLVPTAAVGQVIVWTDGNARRIQSKDADGGEVGTVVQFQASQGATEIHYDPISAKLYYLFFSSGSGSFQRVGLDGSDPENIPTPSWGRFALNVELRKLYWVDFGQTPTTLHRSELNGTEVVSHTYPSCCIYALEAVGNDLFFSAGGTMRKGTWRADADGSNEQFLHPEALPEDLAHDPLENKLYLAAHDGIYRINSDGTGFVLVLQLPSWRSFVTSPTQIAVDSRARKLYWADRLAKVIQRSNMDGSKVEDFVTVSDVGNPNFDVRGLTIVDGQNIPGACCDGDPFDPCIENIVLSDCQCATCNWHKLQSCDEIDCPRDNPVPTVSSWGLVVLNLLLMIVAKIVFNGHTPSPFMRRFRSARGRDAWKLG